MTTPRCLSIATSDSGGGAGIQADLKAFAAAGCHGMTALVGVTAQNSTAILATHPLPTWIITAQLEAVYDDIGVDAAKTGALLSADIIAAVADFLRGHPTPLVVDPVLRASTGAPLLDPDAVELLIRSLLPLATVVTPNLAEARVLAGGDGDRESLARLIVARGAPAVLITGGGREGSDLLLDSAGFVEIPVTWVDGSATHGTGCTHSATLAAALALGMPLDEAARHAADVTAAAIEHGLVGIGEGAGPVAVGQPSWASHRVRTR
ncbi:MAG TPA: bifunctional hydroxymethylpyrimidine kinase/phosphomethylpyrimidine kinase [Candidatus Saccharimonadales bacterium]|nr:bifunctional hydroxymethylpyrimidine kinase/phosphomethylpyrimidine kinase [Candidatus Saccharimonadales bacterium]